MEVLLSAAVLLSVICYSEIRENLTRERDAGETDNVELRAFIGLLYLIGSIRCSKKKDSTLVSYCSRRNKVLLILSTIHFDEAIDSLTGEAQKPEMVTFYNNTEVGGHRRSTVPKGPKKYKATAEGLPVSVYYETLCPDCIDFFRTQLKPTYDQLADYLDLDLIPFGKGIVSYKMFLFL
nr:unnamed protein product [Callosobruchus analis]